MKMRLSLSKFARRAGLFGAVSALALLALCIAMPAAALAAPTQGQKCARNDVHCVISVGDTLIADRQAALTKLSSNVSQQLSAKHITSDQANALQADIATNQNGLRSLKAKLDGEHSADAARQDVKNIFQQFRIYAVVLPRDYQQLHFDIERKLDSEMEGVKPQIEKAIDKAPAGKKARLETLFSDFKNQLATAEAQFDTVQTTLPTLTPENYNLNRTTYQANLAKVHNAEKTAHNALHQAAKDLHEITQLLK